MHSHRLCIFYFFSILSVDSLSSFIGQLLEQLPQLQPPLEDLRTDLKIIYAANATIIKVINISMITPSSYYLGNYKDVTLRITFYNFHPLVLKW